ncbi:hypothetical protein Cylst_0741 [Cylindrospermum stagnale PCC 7417]|uniref:CHAT domain-containing protein n=1 Tax=Cylindrospermum stagnale PCC 7417 TaxID=56107 RepID=K9WSA6_9NOST|nr:tetratricopeptide repeat protein [Cylindrospermum stagnale]AFZ23068.1 hypothetical protein Cylst_0741 [Cylindrospermum stagnale PCC 7417]
MTLNPNLETLLQQGNDQLDRGNYQAAFATFQQAVTLEPPNPQVFYGLGLASFRLERYQEAVKYLNQALVIQPDYILALARRGMAYKQLKETQLADADFEQSIALSPQNAEDWRGRGLALDELERHEEAIASYDKVIEFKPDDDTAWYNRGIALYALGRYEEAITSYDKAIEFKPDDNIAWGSRGIVLYELERYEKAIASYDKAIEFKPNDDTAWNNRGNALYRLGRYEEAITSYDKAIEFKPDDDTAWNNRGNALFHLGRDKEAIASFDKAIEFKPNKDEAWFNRGKALNDLGRYEEAIASFDKAIEFKPGDHYAWNGQGFVLDDLGRYEEAIASYDKAIEFKPDYHEAWFNRGIALFHLGREEKAIKSWLEAKAICEQALNSLSFENFPQRNMQTLQELLRVCSALGDTQTFQQRQEEATQRLEELVSKCQSKEEEITLRRKYAAFDQLRVDIRLQSPNKQQHIKALELAEARKNICLAWLREGWDDQPPSFDYQDMQKLLNPQTAAVYWHISPNAITTFIIKHNQPPIVLFPVKREIQFYFNSFSQTLPQQRTSNFLDYFQQLKRFQEWMQQWKQDYQDYCEGNYTNTAKETAPWRQKMDNMLLTKLCDILEINRILENLQDIEELILIPHRELHLLPLDCLFPGKSNITYLPSFQIGIKLLAQPYLSPQAIVNVVSNELAFSTIESVALASLYPECQPLQIPPVKHQELIMALQQNTGLFHFSGHGNHNPKQPRESFLMLTESDKLTLGDIFDNDELDFSKYELICLSACETGMSSSENLIDEYVGLVSGFLAKGANYVVSTLWRVDERSTAILMIRFYQLIKETLTPPAALRQAKEWLSQLTYKGLANWYLELANKLNEPQCREFIETEVQIIKNDPNKITSSEPIYAHPYYWAGFILTGKPR